MIIALCMATVPTVAERPATIRTLTAWPHMAAGWPFIAERPATIRTVAQWPCTLLSAMHKGYIPHYQVISFGFYISIYACLCEFNTLRRK